MTWYCAHVIFYIDKSDSAQDEFPVYENVYMMKARDDEEAERKAGEIGRAEEGGSIKWDGESAKIVFGGIRKIILCQSDYPDRNEPASGTEVTYSQMVVKGRENLQRLIDGEPVTVCYEE